MKNSREVSLSLLLAIGLGLACASFAQSVLLPNPLDVDNFNDLIQKVIDFIFTLSIFIAPLMIIVAGFLFVTAGGDSNKITTAKNIILWTSVGFFIILMSKGIFEAIKGLLGAS